MKNKFDFEEFKAGKSAKNVDFDTIYNFLYIDESLSYPIVCKVTDKRICEDIETGIVETYVETYISSFPLDFLERHTKLVPTKKTFWISIGKAIDESDNSKLKILGKTIDERGNGKLKIEPFGIPFNTKEEALNHKCQYWEIIDAIPYTYEV